MGRFVHSSSFVHVECASILLICLCFFSFFFSTVTLYYLSSMIENNDALRNKKETHTHTSHHWVSAQNVFDCCNMCTLYTVCGYFSNAQISWASFPTLFPTNRIYCVLCSHCVLYMLRIFLFKESVHSIAPKRPCEWRILTSSFCSSSAVGLAVVDGANFNFNLNRKVAFQRQNSRNSYISFHKIF